MIQKKIRMIQEYDYSRCSIREGHEWYFEDGSHLSIEESKEYMLAMMGCMKSALNHLQSLRNSIDSCIVECDLSGDLFQDVLELGDTLSQSELDCLDYINKCSYLTGIQPVWNDHPFDIPESDLPF